MLLSFFNYLFFFKKELMLRSIFLWVLKSMTLFSDKKANFPTVLFLADLPRPHPLLFRKRSPYLVLLKAAPYSNKFCARPYELWCPKVYTKILPFHTYGDILASLFTLMGTRIYCMNIVFIWNPDVKLSEKADQMSTDSLSVLVLQH